MNIQHAKQEKRGMFFIEENGNKVARLTYNLENNKMVIDHTIVEESLRGQDIGSGLVDEAVMFARETNLKIVPVCTYAKKILERGEQYKDVLA